MEAPPTFNMFGRRADSVVRADELHFGYAQLWEGSAADINLQTPGLWSSLARAGCDEKEGRRGGDKGKYMKEGTIAP